jgi:hypothetical protein
MMKCVLFLSSLLTISTIATAAELPYTPKLTCGAVTNLVRTKGATLLRTGWKKYDRYVTDAAYCQPSARLLPAVVTTTDNPACPVGYRCRERTD